MGMSIKEVCEFFFSLEKKYDLLEFEIDGVKPWQFRRMALYYELSEKSGILEQAHVRLNFKDKLARSLLLLKNIVFNNPFLADNTDLLIFSHYRSKKVDNTNIDIYTHFFKQDLFAGNISYTDLERPFLGKHIRKNESNKSYLDFIVLLGNLFQFLVPVKASDSQKKVFKDLNNDIKNHLGIDFDSERFLLRAVKRFKVNHYLYSLLFNRLKPKEIYLVIAYAHGDVVKAAKDLGIKVNELQHGTFSQYHLGYSFPNRKADLDYFPDNFLVWNKYWKEMIELPIKRENIKIKSFQYLEIEKTKYMDNRKIKNSLVIISQGAISRQLSKTIIDNFSLFEHMQVNYKLHPGEYERWEENPFLVELNKKENVTIVFDINLYELFSVSEYQLGVFSTALYEGVEFGCKTILADLPGIEYMDKFIRYYKLTEKKGFYGSIV
jgi:hypothetical protein